MHVVKSWLWKEDAEELQGGCRDVKRTLMQGVSQPASCNSQ